MDDVVHVFIIINVERRSDTKVKRSNSVQRRFAVSMFDDQRAAINSRFQSVGINVPV